MIYLQLLLGFLKVGCFSFGGAYGAIPLIRDIVLSYGWLSDDELAYMIGISESTPGPIMLNLAAYVGISQSGILGAVVATLAVALPSFLIILLVTAAFSRILKNNIVQSALKGVKPCIIGIICATGLFLILQKACVPLFQPTGTEFQSKQFYVTLIITATFVIAKLTLKKKITPPMLILMSAGLGILLFAFL